MRLTIVCKDCGDSVVRPGQATRCLPCARKPRRRIAAPGRVMAADRAPTRTGDGWACRDCGGRVVATMPDGRKHRPALRCDPCRLKHFNGIRYLSGQTQAHAAVARAVRHGDLPHPSTLGCSDCERQAEQYDHRDYGRPLEVDAVCRSCNLMRGPAKWRDAAPVDHAAAGQG